MEEFICSIANMLEIKVNGKCEIPLNACELKMNMINWFHKNTNGASVCYFSICNQKSSRLLQTYLE